MRSSKHSEDSQKKSWIASVETGTLGAVTLKLEKCLQQIPTTTCVISVQKSAAPEIAEIMKDPEADQLSEQINDLQEKTVGTKAFLVKLKLQYFCLKCNGKRLCFHRKHFPSTNTQKFDLSKFNSMSTTSFYMSQHW